MKWRMLFGLAALSMAACVPGDAEKHQFTLTVHVESSEYSVSCNPNYMCYGLQKLNVTIDGKKQPCAAAHVVELNNAAAAMPGANDGIHGVGIGLGKKPDPSKPSK